MNVEVTQTARNNENKKLNIQRQDEILIQQTKGINRLNTRNPEDNV